jgi:two-component system, sensor histidine kinase and response regulator
MTNPPPARILIVDDEVAQMKALCHTLGDQGYDTAGFASAKMALAELSVRQFDLVLTDLMMPEMDGITLLRAALQTDPHLIGIIMTGEGTIATAVEAMKSGAFDYILKPFKLSVILPVLARALAMRQLRFKNAELELRVNQRTAELEAANQELEAFSFSVSHDLRAPLRHISGFTTALKDDPGSTFGETGKRCLAAITQSSERMSALIAGLLAFSRTGRAALREAECDMTALVQEVITELAADTQDRNIEWDLQPLPKATVDRVLFKEAWVNLISNAVKYSRPRDPAKIKIGCVKKNDEWEFSVADNGVGFDMHYVDKLFGVFQRLHSADEFEGTGVGLANVRRTVSRHGGRTWAESVLDQGAVIYFTLPVKRDQAD